MIPAAPEVTVHPGLSAIPAQEWDALACPEAATGRPLDPFTTHRFLAALESSGSTGPGTGWQPRPMLVRQGGKLIAAAPLYVKSHSRGEYIFDHGWAEAYQNAGGAYYPKLQIAVPFTPATGRRFLTAPGCESQGRAALIAAAVQTARDNHLSSLHVTFCTADEAESIARDHRLLHRVTEQFHWANPGYTDFDDFLASLAARKRKAIRHERDIANRFGGSIVALTGDQIEPAHWDAFWAFYQDTGARKWGTPYLTRAAFDAFHATMRDDILLVLALRDGRAVAGALNFIGRDTLFGRYWGATEHHPCLHFELCYYRAIDWAIAHRLTRIEAGAQGEHKLARGYLPTPVHSLHWFADPRFSAAVARYLDAERRAVGDEMAALAALGPFRHGTAPPDR